ncbi:protein phosphatase 1 regulatory subunit 15 [Calliopsis andreniformis]|uniref:protein phosphatase 1 regulatory subunit 15 n=1 Tax=Calliopsis andreniformis TaxID=337506 RepID=UPI003FCCBF41
MATEEMYSMNETLKRQGNMSAPKKENMLHSVFNAWNVLCGQISKMSTSVLASINYPLSVTVVHNEGLISHELFENFTSKREMLSTDNIFIHNSPIKESLNILEHIPREILDENKPYVNTIFNQNSKENLLFSYNYIDHTHESITRFDKKESISTQNDKNETINSNYLLPIEDSSEKSTKLFDHICSDDRHETRIENVGNYEETSDKLTSNKDEIPNSIDDTINNTVIINEEPLLSKSDSNTLSMQPVQVTTSNMLTNMWQRVRDSVTNRFYKTDSIESDVTIKRSSLSPKQRRKMNTVAKGRGRGRAKSQLRRSGVSQTRHRKERIKHELEADIQNDFRNWQESEIYCTQGNKQLEDYYSLDEDTVDGCTEPVTHIMFTIADVEPNVQKLKARNHGDQRIPKFSSRKKHIPKCTERSSTYYDDCFENKYNMQRSMFRPRLMSESSIDSEDSYCIVFETGSEAAYKSDYDDSDESDTDQVSEDEEEDERENRKSPAPKVKFNLNPVVHVMVQWDYAYRAARRGPWEEMARDRERFRGRINCIERVLNPILTSQHRTHIWQERFAHIE